MSDPSSPPTFRMASAVAAVATWMHESGLFYVRKVRVVRYDLPAAVLGEPTADMAIREASEQDLRDLARTLGREVSEWLAKRAEGSVCLAARSGRDFLGYLWITRAAEMMTEVNHVIDVSRDAGGAYLYDGYVLAPHRRKGVLRTLLATSKQWAVQQGLSRLYAAYVLENRVSEHALERAGFVTTVGTISVLRVLGREWKRIRTPPQLPAIDVLQAAGPSRRLAGRHPA